MTQYSVYSKSADFRKVYFSLSAAKKQMKELIKAGHTDVTGSITKIYSNGDWEPMGKIDLGGNNATIVANSPRNQKKKGY